MNLVEALHQMSNKKNINDNNTYDLLNQTNHSISNQMIHH
jgi:hypothetical protein